MTVQKFRSLGEMNAAPVLTRGGQEGFERFLRHCARLRRLSSVRYRPGVVKFRSIEEAEAARTAQR